METRAKILQAVYESLCQKGYRGTNINEVVISLGLTKGALYYHFKGGKQELVREVIEGLLKPRFLKPWHNLNRKKTKTVPFLIRKVEKLMQNSTEESLALGSCFFNLLQEMPGQDAELQKLLADILLDLHESITSAFQRASHNGEVKATLKARQEAWHFLAAYQGAISLGRSLQDIGAFQRTLKALNRHLERLEKRKG
jgi:AcrR family transcriptional regulator